MSTELQRLVGWRREARLPRLLDECCLVIPTYQRPKEALVLLERLASIPDAPGEVVVVDGSPEDLVGAAIRDWARPRELSFDLIYVRTPAGLTRQRNVGVDASSGEFVFFLDDDCRPLPGYFREMRRVFLDDRNGQVGGVCGSIINEIDRPLSSLWRIRLALGLAPRGQPGAYYPTATSVPRGLAQPFSGVRPIEVMPGGAAAYRRAVFSRHRFSEFFSGYAQGEDVEMSRRIARDWKLLSCGDAHVIHDHAEHGRPAGFRRGRMVVRNRYFIWKRHSPEAAPADRLKFWLDQALIAVYQVAFFLTHPAQLANLFYAFGVVFGAAECIFLPPRYEEPPAMREYELALEQLSDE